MSARATATSPAGARGEPHTAHHAKVRLTPRAAVLFVSVFFVSVLSIAPIRTYLAQQDRLEQLREQATAMEARNAALRARLADLRDPVTLERLARECLGMVRPGEIAFVVIPRGEAPTPPDCG
jgi:cell division protein FtsB